VYAPLPGERDDIRIDLLAALQHPEPRYPLAVIGIAALASDDWSDLEAFVAALQALCEDALARRKAGAQLPATDAVEALAERVTADALARLEP
jgi:hypothetical protein